MLPAGVLFINLAMHHIANYFLIFGCFVIFCYSFFAVSQNREEKNLLYGPKEDWYSLLGNRMWLWKKGKLRAQNSIFLNHLHSYGGLQHWTSLFWKCWKLVLKSRIRRVCLLGWNVKHILYNFKISLKCL